MPTPLRRLVGNDLPPDAPFPYVYVERDGGVRELDARERDYLREPFLPADGGRPSVKWRYGERTPDGSLHGFLLRTRVPRRMPIAPARE